MKGNMPANMPYTLSIRHNCIPKPTNIIRYTPNISSKAIEQPWLEIDPNKHKTTVPTKVPPMAGSSANHAALIKQFEALMVHPNYSTV
jgi:hypothetical protein